MSSYSSNIIAIDNLLLLEILQRYKELGAFGDEPMDFVIGHWTEAECEFDPDVMEYVLDDRWSLTPAISWDSLDEEFARHLEIPRTLNDVLRVIIDYIEENVFAGQLDDGAWDGDSYSAMMNELKEREEEILQRYDRVRMENSYIAYNDGYQGLLDELTTFWFDRENG